MNRASLPLPLALLAALVALLIAAPARADPLCDGPPECCPAVRLNHLPQPVVVAVGVALQNLYNVDDRAQSWDADYYLYESWPPTPGFTPQTEVVNEISSQGSQFDETVLHEGRCVRSRRMHSTLHARFALQMFPFDHEALVLRLSDAERPADELVYAREPYLLALDPELRDEVPSWQVAERARFATAPRRVTLHPGAPRYDTATISVDVTRRSGFYLTRFFLPLALIMIVAFSVFWIHPEDLGSQVGVGVTCLLAVIAFQFGESTTLPAVEYLTLADRVYATSYFLITLALVESVYTNILSRRGHHDRAATIDRIARVAFPAAAVLFSAASVLLARGHH